MISGEKISDIVNKIVLFYKPDKVILFGSYAKGLANEDSDIDLIVIKNTELPKQKRGREIRKYLYGSLVPMDIKVYTPNEFYDDVNNPYSFIYEAIKDSKVLYELKEIKLKKTKFGCAKGRFKMSLDFDAPLDDLKDYM